MKNSSTSAATRKVLVDITLGKSSSNDILSGILHQMEETQRLNISLIQKDDNPLTAEKVRACDINLTAGIILTEIKPPEIMHEIAATELPVVAIGFNHPLLASRKAPTAFIRNDNAEIGRMGAEHFLSLGKFSSYGFVRRTVDDQSWVDERQEAFRKTLAGALKKPEISVFSPCGPTPRTGLAELAKWLKSLPKPAAVMAACDSQTAIVLDACIAEKIKVPDSIALLGVDNDQFTCFLSLPTLSSILPGHQEMGRRAVRELERLIKHGKRKSLPREITIAPQSLIVRESSALRSPSAALVENARRFIKANAAAGIKVTHVAAHLKISRRLLEMRYRAATGSSVRSDIEAERMARLKKLLSSTTRPITAIAAECGFKNLSSLANRFKKLYGTSMREFRKEDAFSSCRQS
jgi:LacI family transcriptional regulator